MARRTVTSVKLKPDVRAIRVYPVEGSKRSIDELQTIGLRLSAEQAIHLARVLLAASQDWAEVEICARRFKQRKSDGTFEVTVTHQESEVETANEAAILAESALAKDWLRPEEDEAWKHLADLPDLREEGL